MPFAVILGCSDSRVSPEIVFDQGVGDLFVVRNAGNVISDIEMNSIEYAVKVLKASVILVLGHENCGAVTAVVEGQAAAIPAVAALIEPAVKESKGLSGNPITNAIKMNVKRSVDDLKASKEFSSMVQQKQLIIFGGYYNLHSGLVEIL
jgi:carbonic anhydrase